MGISGNGWKSFFSRKCSTTSKFFWQRLWLQKPLENFLCVVSIRFEYIKHSPRSGECCALWIMTVRSTKHFLLKEIDFQVDFWKSGLWSFAKLRNILSFCVNFWRRRWLQKPVETFLYVVRIRFEYVKHSPRSGECSTLWIRAVWCVEWSLCQKGAKSLKKCSGIFENSQN